MTRETQQILGELTPYKKRIAIIAISGIVMSLASWQVAVQMKSLFDALEAKNATDILQAPLRILGFTFLMTAGRYIHLSLMNYTADEVTTNLREKLQTRFMNLSVGFHSHFATGSGGLISRLFNDISFIRDGLRMVADFFREPILLFFLIGWLFVLNWRLTISIFVALPLVLWFIRQISRSLRKYGEQSQTTLEQMTSTIKESLEGVRVIQSFNLQSEMQNRFKKEASTFMLSRWKVHSRVELVGPVTEFIATLVTVAIFIYLGLEIKEGRATLGDFASYLTSLLMLQAPIKKIQESYVRIQETMVAVRRVFVLLENQDEIVEPKNPVPFPTSWKTITYRNVSFKYGRDDVLKNINLVIRRGEAVAFVGTSGSGKTTLVNLLERFFDPTSGEVLIDDINIKNFSLADLRNHIALVNQDVFLFNDSIQKNIHAGRFDRSSEHVEQAAIDSHAHDFISKIPGAYQSTVGDRGALLSGGEKQRISIARALFKNAPILILDEATSALDSASEMEVQKGLDRLMEGRTSLVIAHRLSTVAKAHRIVVLSKGEIVESGTHGDLLNHGGAYHHFFKLQTQA